MEKKLIYSERDSQPVLISSRRRVYRAEPDESFLGHSTHLAVSPYFPFDFGCFLY